MGQHFGFSSWIANDDGVFVAFGKSMMAKMNDVSLGKVCSLTPASRKSSFRLRPSPTTTPETYVEYGP